MKADDLRFVGMKRVYCMVIASWSLTRHSKAEEWLSLETQPSSHRHE